MKLPRLNAHDRLNYTLELAGISTVARGVRSRLISAGSGVCYAILNEDGECVVSGNNCVEGSPEAIKFEYMGQTICGCRCD